MLSQALRGCRAVKATLALTAQHKIFDVEYSSRAQVTCTIGLVDVTTRLYHLTTAGAAFFLEFSKITMLVTHLKTQCYQTLFHMNNNGARRFSIIYSFFSSFFLTAVFGRNINLSKLNKNLSEITDNSEGRMFVRYALRKFDMENVSRPGKTSNKSGDSSNGITIVICVRNGTYIYQFKYIREDKCAQIHHHRALRDASLSRICPQGDRHRQSNNPSCCSPSVPFHSPCAVNKVFLSLSPCGKIQVAACLAAYQSRL